MAEKLCNVRKSDSSSYNLKDVYRDLVMNHTYDVEYTFNVISNRTSFNEGKVGINTTTHDVHIYADFETLQNLGSGDWYEALSTDTGIANYEPKQHDSTIDPQTLITDGTSTDRVNWWIGKSPSSATNSAGIWIQKGKTFAADKHYIVYGSWTY